MTIQVLKTRKFVFKAFDNYLLFILIPLLLLFTLAIKLLAGFFTLFELLIKADNVFSIKVNRVPILLKPLMK